MHVKAIELVMATSTTPNKSIITQNLLFTVHSKSSQLYVPECRCIHRHNASSNSDGGVQVLHFLIVNLLAGVAQFEVQARLRNVLVLKYHTSRY